MGYIDKLNKKYYRVCIHRAYKKLLQEVNGEIPMKRTASLYDGICGRSGWMVWDVQDIVEQWPMYSGTNTWPVPNPNYDGTAVFEENTHKWDGEYGRRRKDLLMFVINKLDEEHDAGLHKFSLFDKIAFWFDSGQWLGKEF